MNYPSFIQKILRELCRVLNKLISFILRTQPRECFMFFALDSLCEK